MGLSVVITAAGHSRRMGGGNKLLLPLCGQPLLVHTLRVFQQLPLIDEVVVSAPSGQEDTYRRLFEEHGFSCVKAVVTGGAQRQNSIYEALLAFAQGSPPQYIAVHDGARPVVTPECITSLFEALPGCDGVIPALPVKDTIKRVDADGVVLETLVRSELMAVQTPQVFKYQLLVEAYRQCLASGFVGTDDASLVERLGGKVRVIPGDYRNIKVTTAEDVAIAERYLSEV